MSRGRAGGGPSLGAAEQPCPFLLLGSRAAPSVTPDRSPRSHYVTESPGLQTAADLPPRHVVVPGLYFPFPKALMSRSTLWLGL